MKRIIRSVNWLILSFSVAFAGLLLVVIDLFLSWYAMSLMFSGIDITDLVNVGLVLFYASIGCCALSLMFALIAKINESRQ